jgi:hypothetical protein
MEIILTMGLVSVILGTASGAQNVGILGAFGVGSYIALAGAVSVKKQVIWARLQFSSALWADLSLQKQTQPSHLTAPEQLSLFPHGGDLVSVVGHQA